MNFLKHINIHTTAATLINYKKENKILKEKRTEVLYQAGLFQVPERDGEREGELVKEKEHLASRGNTALDLDQGGGKKDYMEEGQAPPLL